MLRVIRKILLIIFVCILLLLVFFGIHYFHQTDKFPVTTVVVQGVPDTSQAQVQHIIQNGIHKGLLALNLQKLQFALEKLPWIESAEIQRLWPDKLKVTIVPREIVAYWNDKYFLNKYMEVVPIYSDAVIPENLPRLYGPDTSQVKAGYYYQLFSQTLAPINLFIIQLQLADNGDISLLLNNGIKIQLGQQHVLTRLRRFVKVYPSIFAEQKDMSGDVVDLRYPSGMALQRGEQ